MECLSISVLVVQTITKYVVRSGDSQFMIVSMHFPGQIEENNKNLSNASLLTEIHNTHFWNTIQRYI